ncbi:MAG: response regulator transcription factor [Bacteroidetes bacterium]|nr:response regulator transcription factor [Bacteroidota bacterium]
MEIKIVIVDDEADSRNVLKKLLQKFCPNIIVCGEADNVQKARQIIAATKPQAVFLDIQMPKANGFDLLQKYIYVPFEVIFITSYDKYALEAIRFSALDYLLKPVEVEELKRAVKRLETRQDIKNQNEKLTNLLAHIESKEIEKKIAVHVNDKVKFIPLSAITHMEGERNYTLLYNANGEKYSSSKNLGEFEEMLQAYSQFMRISKSCLANINHVSGYSKGEPCVLTIARNFGFEISRRKKQEILEKLKW